MRALRFRLPKNVRVEDVDEPRLQDDRDAIVRVTSTAICGSDLHIYNGLLPQLRPMTLGHEFMGVVEEVGPAVRNLREGDRVIVPFAVADGTCWFCQRNLQPQCEGSNSNYGPEGGLLKEKGAGLFGYSDMYGGYDGGQAERVRVPFADYGPRKVPAGLRDEEVLPLTDIAPTAWTGLEWANLQPGESVAVLGCGPVGLATMKLARMRGAELVVGVDPQDYRRDKARDLAGAEVVDPNERDPVEAIRALTDGRGADVVVDAVGMEADRNILEKASAVVHVQRGTLKVVRTAFSAARRAGRVSILGVYGTPFDNFPIGQAFDKGLSISMGQSLVHKHVDELLGHVKDGRVRFDDIFTHTLPLDEAPYGYSIFNGKEDGCVKVLLKP